MPAPPFRSPLVSIASARPEKGQAATTLPRPRLHTLSSYVRRGYCIRIQPHSFRFLFACAIASTFHLNDILFRFPKPVTLSAVEGCSIHSGSICVCRPTVFRRLLGSQPVRVPSSPLGSGLERLYSAVRSPATYPSKLEGYTFIHNL